MTETGRITKRIAPFTMISNHAITNPNLSTAAKGLYTLITYYTGIPNFKLYKTKLMEMVPEGERKFDKMWKELKDEGYLVVHKVNTHTGFIYHYELLEEPEDIDNGETENANTENNLQKKEKEGIKNFSVDDIPWDDDYSPSPTFCRAGEPRAGKPRAGECRPINNTIKNNTINNNNINNNTDVNRSEKDCRIQDSIYKNECSFAFEDYYDYAYRQVNAKNAKEFITYTNTKETAIDEWVTAMAEIYTHHDEYMYIGKKKYKTLFLKHKLLKLNHLNFVDILMQFNSKNYDAKKQREYIKALLINGINSLGYSQLQSYSYYPNDYE